MTKEVAKEVNASNGRIPLGVINMYVVEVVIVLFVYSHNYQLFYS